MSFLPRELRWRLAAHMRRLKAHSESLADQSHGRSELSLLHWWRESL